MEWDGSLVGAGVAALIAIISAAGAMGRISQKVTRLYKVVDRIAEELEEHMQDDADRLARIETKLENQTDFHTRIEGKLDRLMER